MFTIEESKRDVGVKYVINDDGLVAFIGESLDDCLAFARGLQEEARAQITTAKIAVQVARTNLDSARQHDEEARELISLITEE